MDEKSRRTLELPSVLERLARQAHFSASKELAQALEPTADFNLALRRQQETTEARKLLSINLDLTIGGAHDVRPQAAACARGNVLEASDFLPIKNTLEAGRRLQRMFERMEESFPALESIIAGMETATGLIDAISRTMDDRGEILDNASPALNTCRREMRVVRERIHSKLQRMVSDSKIMPMLQEPIVTQRDGRFVIPLRAEFKGRIKSVIHDQSASGATLFVEPLTVVEMNNELRELELKERDEIRRILTELSQRVGERQESIAATVASLAVFDLALAKARYADILGAAEPVLKPIRSREGHPGAALRLLAARHPLLDPGVVVPIDVLLDDAAFAMVITGPNTGGKTVSLKTAGLLALMAQCGLHIPATSGSELAVFDNVFADIGDEQSIEQSLSTFSGHVANISHILKYATPGSLVLLDELGSGTDPQEGAALARAILAELIQRTITTLVATHYPEMKVYAQTTTGVANASMEFDLESLRPTYRLLHGLPGRSNALAIAERLGLDSRILERARGMVSPDDLQTDSLLDEIHHQRDLSRRTQADLEERQQRLSAYEAELSERLRNIEEERRTILEEARQQSEEDAEAVREELRKLQGRLRRAAKPLDEVEAASEELAFVEKKVARPVKRKHRAASPERALRVGDRVLVERIDSFGIITSLGASDAEIQIGNLRLRAGLDELELSGQGDDESKPGRTSVTRKGKKPAATLPAAPPLELDLRGYRVDEGLEALERHLDAAFAASMPFFRVIHGKGTGRLRTAIRSALQGSSFVRASENGKPSEGGDGVTIVHLKGE